MLRSARRRDREQTSMKKTKKAIVVVNDCFGFGARFNVRQAEWSDKSVEFKFVGRPEFSGSKHLRRTQTFAIATRKLVLEANTINRMQDRVNDRAKKFRELLQKEQVR